VVSHKVKVQSYLCLNESGPEDHNPDNFYSGFKSHFESEIHQFRKMNSNQVVYRLFYSKDIVDKLKFEF
jgi:hypothetical protein